MTSQEWAKRYDYREEHINALLGQSMEEEVWAMRMGFGSADEYHRESDEAFAEGVREDVNWEAW